MAKIQCIDHEDVEWAGHVVCASCQRVYQTSDDELPNFAPMECECGVKLMPDKNNGKKRFSARVCCPACYEQRIEQRPNKELH